MGMQITVTVHCDCCKTRTVFSLNSQQPDEKINLTHHLPIGWQYTKIGTKWYYACGNGCYKNIGMVDKKGDNKTVFTSERCWPEIGRNNE